MFEQAKTYHIELVSWMKDVHDAETGQVAYVVGQVKDMQNTLAVSITKTGGTRFFCQTHQRIFRPGESCPACAKK